MLKSPIDCHRHIGDLVVGVITEKRDDHLVVQIDGNIDAILPMCQLHDNVLFSPLQFNKLNIGDHIKCLILEIEFDHIILSLRYSFLANNSKIPFCSQSLSLHQKTYGYVKECTTGGTTICFLGHATGFIPDKQLPVGNTVFVECIKNEKFPILDLRFSKSLELMHIESYFNLVQHNCGEYEPGQVILTSQLTFIKEEGGFFYYKSKENYDIIILPTFNQEPPTQFYICYVDANNNTYYGIDHGVPFNKDPPLSCKATCIIKFDTISIMRYRQIYFIVKNEEKIDIGSKVYLTISFSISNNRLFFNKPAFAENRSFPIYIGFIEPLSKEIFDNTNILHVDIIYKEWAICYNETKTSFYLMHRTQIEGEIFIGKEIKGSLLYLKGLTLLINNPGLPLFHEDCYEGQSINGLLAKYDENRKKHSIIISPFIIGTMKEKNLNNVLFNTYKCKISRISDDKVTCEQDYTKFQVRLTDYYPGLYYKVESPTKTYDLDVMDCTHSFEEEMRNETPIEVFLRDESRVSVTLPPIAYQQLKLGDRVNCSIYRITKTNIYVHISHDINGIIPIDYYEDYLTKLEPITPPHIGEFIYCCIIDIKDDVLILSHRKSDVKNTTLTPLINMYYKASLVHVDEEITLFSEALGMQIKVPKLLCRSRHNQELINIGELHEEQVVYIRRESGSSDEFKIASITYNHTFAGVVDDESENEEIFIPIYESESTEFEASDENSELDIKNGKEIHDKITKDNMHIEQNVELKNIRPVIYRTYASIGNIKVTNLKLLLKYMQTHEIMEDIDILSQNTKVSRKTLIKWYEKVKEDMNWSPMFVKKIKTHRAMDTLLEDSIMYYIYTKFLSKGFQFNDKMCKSIALQFWEQYPDHRIAKKFTASNRWIKRFKENYGITNRRAHYHRRPTITASSSGICKQFYETITELYKKHKDNNSLQYLINIDETTWKLCFFGDMTWASKGSEHVEFSSDFNDKENLTVIAAVTADERHKKLPLCLIRKGQSERALRIFDDIKQNFQIEVTPSGWATVPGFAHYLIWLRKELDMRYKDIPGHTEETDIDLIIDLYASHRNIKIKELAKKLHFNLHYIPAGFTDSFQPLDRYIFGALKSMARSMFYTEYAKDPTKHHTIEHACEILLECWARLSDETINKAWSIYSDQGDCDIDSLINRGQFDIHIDGRVLELKEEEREQTCTGDNSDDSDNELYEEDCNEIAYDVFKENAEITDDIAIQMKTAIKKEKYIKSKNTNKRLAKPIININNTCNANTTTQIISIVPDIRERLTTLKEIGEMENDILLKAIDALICYYDKYDSTVPELPLNLCFDIETDACSNLNYIMQKSQYGLIINGEEIISMIDLTSEDETACDIIHKKINDLQFEFSKCFAIKKEQGLDVKYEDSFMYGKFVFILKAVVCNVEDSHYYAFIRNDFSEEFYLVNDSSIKIASKEQIDTSPAVLGLYYVFQHLDPIPEKHSTTTLTTKKLEISDDIKKILRDIENENKSTRIVEETTKVADEVESRFGTIIPCVRITLGKKISEEEDYIGEMFSKKIEEARKELDSHLPM